MTDPDPHPTIFYDGECGLCDKSVRWIMARDKRRTFRFAPLQGETYENIDASNKPTDVSSVVLYDNDTIHTMSDASIRIGKHLGGFWSFCASIARIVPRPIRDVLYRFIAKRRKRIFGGAEACKLPTREEREQLLP